MTNDDKVMRYTPTYRAEMEEDDAGGYVHHDDYAEQASAIAALKEQLARAERALVRGGFVDHGAAEWKPPLGKPPVFIEVAAPPVQRTDDVREDILGAVARGWCAPENASKVMDEKLAFAIAREVQALATTRPGAALTDGDVAKLAFKHCSGMVKGDQWAFSLDQMKVMARAILAASGGAEHVVPEGMALVPLEPTTEMVNAPNTIIQAYGAKLIYQRMIAASPALQSQQGEGSGK